MVGEIVRWSKIQDDGRECDFREAQARHSLVSFGADVFPAGGINFLIPGDVLGKGVKRKVGGGEGEVSEEGGVLMIVFVFVEKLDGAVGEFGGGVEIAAFFDGRESFVIEVVGLGGEETALIFEVVGTVEAGGDGRAVEVPFTDMVGAVAGGFEVGGGEGRPGGAFSFFGAFLSFDGVATNLLRVVAAEDGGAGGPATCGVVEIGEAEAVLGEGVEVGSFDLGAIAAEVGVAEIIGEDEEDIGFAKGKDRREEEKKDGTHR